MAEPWFAGLFGNAPGAQSLEQQQRQGLMSDAMRSFGLNLLGSSVSGSSDPMGSLAAALQAARGQYSGNVGSTLDLERQGRTDDLNERYKEAYIQELERRSQPEEGEKALAKINKSFFEYLDGREDLDPGIKMLMVQKALLGQNIPLDPKIFPDLADKTKGRTSWDSMRGQLIDHETGEAITPENLAPRQHKPTAGAGGGSAAGLGAAIEALNEELGVDFPVTGDAVTDRQTLGDLRKQKLRQQTLEGLGGGKDGSGGIMEWLKGLLPDGDSRPTASGAGQSPFTAAVSGRLGAQPTQQTTTTEPPAGEETPKQILDRIAASDKGLAAQIKKAREEYEDIEILQFLASQIEGQ